MPPWLEDVLERCESLALDDPGDRVRLWEEMSEALPLKEIAKVIADTLAHQLERRGVSVPPDVVVDAANNAAQALLSIL